MRQAGILAAAGLFGLEKNIGGLKEDHETADYLANQLNRIEQIELVDGKANTNILFLHLKDGRYDEFLEYGKRNGILFGGGKPIRMVTHKQIDKKDIDYAMSILAGFFE